VITAIHVLIIFSQTKALLVTGGHKAIIDRSTSKKLEVGINGVFFSCDRLLSTKTFLGFDRVTSAIFSKTKIQQRPFVEVVIPNFGQVDECKIEADGACGLRVLYYVLLYHSMVGADRCLWRNFALPEIESCDLYSATMDLLTVPLPSALQLRLDKFKGREDFPRSLWMSDAMLVEILTVQNIVTNLWICPKKNADVCVLHSDCKLAVKFSMDALRYLCMIILRFISVHWCNC
jgi:hypothetical protein